VNTIKFCSLFSGSSGNSLFISHENTRVLIDAGVSGKRIQAALESIGEHACDLDAVIVTHEHIDHASCVGVMSRRFNLPAYATAGTWRGMEGFIGPMNEANIIHIRANEDFSIGDLQIHAFSIPHDAADPVGFHFRADGRKVAVATDIGHMNESLLANIRGSDLVMLESNHDLMMLENGRYPYVLKKRIKGMYGHLCNDLCGDTIALLAGEGGRKFLIGHLSDENNNPETAYATVLARLSSNGFTGTETLEIHVAERNKTSRVFEL
jgi:phosphoribosyl 1,2-cyclic phosphodiesterase